MDARKEAFKKLSFDEFCQWFDRKYATFPPETINKIFKDVAANVHTTKDWYKKLKYLFENIRKNKFKIDICWPDVSVKYHSTVLHALIANENFDEVRIFIKLAHDNQVVINYSAKDNEGKTITLIAIKIGVLELDVIRPMLTKETIANPDNRGVTPLMTACVLGRADVVSHILTQANELISRGELNLTFDEFINMRDEGGRTAAHYAVMREGVRSEIEQSNLNGILRSVYIDKDRDCGAIRNTFMLMPIAHFFKALTVLPNVKLSRCYADGKEIEDGGVMFCQQNRRVVEEFLRNTKGNPFKQLMDPDYMSRQLSMLKNVSIAERAMAGRPPVFKLLREAKADFSIRHKMGRTPQEMVHSFKSRPELTDLERRYLLPIFEQLEVVNMVAPANADDKKVEMGVHERKENLMKWDAVKFWAARPEEIEAYKKSQLESTKTDLKETEAISTFKTKLITFLTYEKDHYNFLIKRQKNCLVIQFTAPTNAFDPAKIKGELSELNELMKSAAADLKVNPDQYKVEPNWKDWNLTITADPAILDKIGSLLRTVGANYFSSVANADAVLFATEKTIPTHMSEPDLMAELHQNTVTCLVQ